VVTEVAAVVTIVVVAVAILVATTRTVETTPPIPTMLPDREGATPSRCVRYARRKDMKPQDAGIGMMMMMMINKTRRQQGQLQLDTAMTQIGTLIVELQIMSLRSWRN
jgi:hypothetical protein